MNTFQKLWANGAFRYGASVLALVFAMGVLAPFLGTVDPAVMDYNNINRAAGHTGPFTLVDGSQVAHAFWLGTDNFGRDLYSRVIYGARVSLLVAVSTALLALIAGGAIGMLAGYFRAADLILMRIMDGLMAIPAILLAIALVAALGASIATVVVAIAIPEIPRVSRLVRSLVLTLREEPFVEFAGLVVIAADLRPLGGHGVGGRRIGGQQHRLRRHERRGERSKADTGPSGFGGGRDRVHTCK